MENMDRTWSGESLGGKTKEGFSVSLTSCWESQVAYKAGNWKGGSEGRIRAVGRNV